MLQTETQFLETGCYNILSNSRQASHLSIIVFLFRFKHYLFAHSRYFSWMVDDNLYNEHHLGYSNLVDKFVDHRRYYVSSHQHSNKSDVVAGVCKRNVTHERRCHDVSVGSSSARVYRGM